MYIVERERITRITYIIPPKTTPKGFSSAAKPMVASWKNSDDLSKQNELCNKSRCYMTMYLQIYK